MVTKNIATIDTTNAGIYISHTIDGLSKVEIAIERKISRAKVKKALAWCRNEFLPYAGEESGSRKDVPKR